MSRGYGLPLVIVALALVAGLLALPDRAGAHKAEYCPSNGIVPGSVRVISTNNGAGEVSGHTIRFQFCGEPEGSALTVANGKVLERRDKIGLLWDGFYLDEPGSVGITLRVGGVWFWPATTEIPHGSGLAVKLTPEQLEALGAASAEAPLAMQFNIPVAAGMRNPDFIGAYRWAVAFFHDSTNFCRASLAQTHVKIVPVPTAQPVIHPSRGEVEPGQRITVVGTGFEPYTPVESVTLGGFTFDLRGTDNAYLTPGKMFFTDASGTVEFDVLVPGLDAGPQPLTVSIGGETASTEILMGSGTILHNLWGVEVNYLEQALGDNFVGAFHYPVGGSEWRLYDPEFPDESDLDYLTPGNCYWIQVREPAEVVLNYTTRNLTCTPGRKLLESDSVVTHVPHSRPFVYIRG